MVDWTDEMDNVEWLRKSSSDEWCGSALNKCADEIEQLREENAQLKDRLVQVSGRAAVYQSEDFNLRKERDALREENARLRADNAWQPIETAPDGESVWLYGGFIANGDGVAENTGVEAWLERGVWFVEEAESFMRSATVVKRPTHWKRLPAPPANAAAAIREGGVDG